MGRDSRLVLASLSIAALFVLALLYHRTRPGDRRRAIGVGITAGAVLLLFVFGRWGVGRGLSPSPSRR